MNVLLTSAGRRGYMVNYFKEALHGMGKVYVGNCDENATSFLYADKTVVTPLIYDNNYISFLLDYCIRENITVIVPLFDIDLYVLSKNKHLFESKGICIIVSDVPVIKNCNDKWKMKCYLEERGFLTPKSFLSVEDAIAAVRKQEVEFPFVIKPRWGMGSIGVYEAENVEELGVLYHKAKKQIRMTYLKYESEQDYDKSVLVQEKVLGQEYGIDIINDLKGTYQNAVIKKKLAMRAGETDIAVTVENKIIDNLAGDLGRKLKHVGNLDMDLILTKNDFPYVIDLNARFGGGYPFSHCAGVNLPQAIVAWLTGSAVKKEMLIPEINIKGYKDIGIIEKTEI